MSTIMDMYLNISDSLSMPDIDIKADTDIFMGGANDLAGFNFADLPPLELEETTDLRWLSSCNSNSSFNLDDDGSTMVNPNTVMPLGSSMALAQSIRSPTPNIKKGGTRPSPPKLVQAVKRDLLSQLKKDIKEEDDEGDDEEDEEVEVKTSTVYPRILPKDFKPVVVKQMIPKQVNNGGRLVTFKNAVQHVMAPVSLNTVRTIQTNANRKQLIANSMLGRESDQLFPKPPYSYSCLIAMALKNSRTGSLPVSEIYNFMCRHFPYFKTAPNGWKNSVRHNLSINKFFAKIEKPAINGAQRKGCLWAMNPTRISKLDDEVQKWSRKDPSAIRRAMLNPDHLELLERGELKFTYEDADNFGDSCGSAESGEGSDTEPENEVESTLDGESQFYDIGSVETEPEDDYEVDVTEEGMYDNIDMGNKDILRVEMALAQKELEYERMISNNKRRKIYLVQE